MYFSIAPNPEIKAHHLEREASDPESLCIIVITIIIITSTIICIHMYLSLSLSLYIYIYILHSITTSIIPQTSAAQLEQTPQQDYIYIYM